MVLSTVDSESRPSSRVVFLKDCDEKRLIFSTGGKSKKGQDLEFNPWVAGTLWWRETLQQISFQGQVVKLLNEGSDKIFQERTRDAQAVAVVSKQSAPLINEEELKDKVKDLINTKDKIMRPEEWHAYCIIPESIEFWHGSKDRFHKRLCYDLVEGSWSYQRLQP